MPRCVLDPDRLEAAFAEPRTRANLAQAYFETPTSLLSTYLLDRPAINAWAGQAPIITDERPLMEFFRHQGGNMNDRDIASLIAIPQAPWDWLEPGPPGEAILEMLSRENRALRAYVRSAVERDSAAGMEAARLARSTEFFLYPFGCTTDHLDRIDSVSEGLQREEAAVQLERCRRLRGTPEPDRGPRPTGGTLIPPCHRRSVGPENRFLSRTAVATSRRCRIDPNCRRAAASEARRSVEDRDLDLLVGDAEDQLALIEPASLP